MKNIAVVLRGHVRTWHFNAPKVFEFYNSIADNVDYYFTTWDTSNTCLLYTSPSPRDS